MPFRNFLISIDRALWFLFFFSSMYNTHYMIFSFSMQCIDVDVQTCIREYSIRSLKSKRFETSRIALNRREREIHLTYKAFTNLARSGNIWSISLPQGANLLSISWLLLSLQMICSQMRSLNRPSQSSKAPCILKYGSKYVFEGSAYFNNIYSEILFGDTQNRSSTAGIPSPDPRNNRVFVSMSCIYVYIKNKYIHTDWSSSSGDQ